MVESELGLLGDVSAPGEPVRRVWWAQSGHPDRTRTWPPRLGDAWAALDGGVIGSVGCV